MVNEYFLSLIFTFKSLSYLSLNFKDDVYLHDVFSKLSTPMGGGGQSSSAILSTFNWFYKFCFHKGIMYSGEP